MLGEKRIDIKPLFALVAINVLNLLLLIINSVEGVFGLWIMFLFISLLPFILKDRRNIIAIIVFLIPLEVTKTLIPFFQLIEAKDGMFNSVFDMARLFMLYSFLVWLLTDLKDLVPFVRHKITYILAIYVGYFIMSSVFISPVMMDGLIEAFRFFTYFLFFIMVIQFIKKKEDFELIWKVLAISALVLSIEGIFEYVFGYYLWVDNGRRASATFLDPNIFARFLIIVLSTLLILRLKKVYVMKQLYMDLIILFSGITLLLTVSRQGLMVFILVLLFISIFLEKKQRQKIIIGVVLGGIVAIPIFLNLLSARDNTLELYDIGQRAGLLLGGALMFISNPLFGVGAEGFQSVIINNYYDLLPWGANGDTLSHTYVLTILAELGIIGFLIFCVFLYFVYKQFKSNYSTRDPKLKAYSLVIFSSIVIILVSSQAEARFFEEPMLWLFLGLHVAIGKLITNKKID